MTERALVPAPREGLQEGVATMAGANGGTLRRGGPGRMRKSLRRLQVEAQHDLARALKLARQMMENEALKPQDRLDAMEFIRRCSGIDKQKPKLTKRSTFSVVSASPAEMAAKLAELAQQPPVPSRIAEPGPAPEAKSGSRGPT
jgi:hypothetical protein